MAKKEKKKFCNVGGQALIEGVMMRSPEKTMLAVRHSDGTVKLEEIPPKKHGKVFKFFAKIPFIRGILGFPTSLSLGYKSLMRSAELCGIEEMEQEAEPGKFEKWLEKVTGGNIMKAVEVFSIIFSLIISIALFVFLPTWAAKGLGELFFKNSANKETWTTIIHAVLKVVIFVGYLAFCAVMKDVKRTLMYHGAEHKSIHCLESGEELTVENVKKQSRFHPRCSTSFLFVMLAFSILFFVCLHLIFPDLVNWDKTWQRMLVNIVCIPIIMGVGFEIIKLLGRFNNWFTKILAAPGLGMQVFTTKEPDDQMIEVAIISLKAALNMEVPNFDHPKEPKPEETENKEESPAEAEMPGPGETGNGENTQPEEENQENA